MQQIKLESMQPMANKTLIFDNGNDLNN